jgi:hypothetical protein
MESTLHPTKNTSESWSQSCLKVVSKLRQLWDQHRVQQKLSRTLGLRVVSNLSQSEKIMESSLRPTNKKYITTEAGSEFKLCLIRMNYKFKKKKKFF